MSKAQLLGLLFELADKLEDNPEFKIILLPRVPFENNMGCFWMKRNNWGAVFNANISNNENHMSFIKTYAVLKYAENTIIQMKIQYPPYFWDNVYVADTLRRLALGDDI